MMNFRFFTIAFAGSIFCLPLHGAVAAEKKADGGIVKAVRGKNAIEVQGEGTVLQNLSDEAKDLEDLNSELMNRTNKPMAVRSLNATQAVFDKSLEKDNTRVTAYSPYSTTKIRVREFMSTLIVLPEGDFIKAFKLADSINFSFQPITNATVGNFYPMQQDLPNSGTVEVNIAGADTSLHIVGTSGNVYTFYVRGDTWDSPFSPTLKVMVSDENLSKKLDVIKRRAEKKAEIEKKEAIALLQLETSKEIKDTKKEKPSDYLEDVVFDPEALYFGYRLVGGKEALRPYMVFDDGKFTYFRFAKGSSVKDVKSFPAVYRVADGSDLPTNTSPIGSMLRVEGVDNKWTLRLGKSYLCIERIEHIPDINSSMNSVVL